MLTSQQILYIRHRSLSLLPQIIAWRRDLHAIPELQMNTVQTEAYIVNALREMGITEIRSGVGGHGVIALIHGSAPGKCVAIRADCDALPIREETGLPFASQNGNMHACGHDAHTAMALGAAKLLMECKEQIKGTVKLIFQPYEEGDRGASAMIHDSALENPRVDAIIALHNHVTPDDDYTPGDILVTQKPTSANIYAYEATFHGPGGHVCLSRTTPNPVHMACNAVAQIAVLPEPGPETVNAVTVAQGGTRNNIVPNTCTIAGSIRSFEPALQHIMRAQVEEILHKCAAADNGSVEVKTTIDVMSTKIDPDLYSQFCEIANALYGESGCKTLKYREMIGEDFARFANQVPGFYFFLHNRPEGSCYPLHNPKFDIDESVLDKGSALFAAFSIHFLNSKYNSNKAVD